MTVIDAKPVPMYVKECTECGSTFTYKKVEVGFGNNIYCPVCGVSLFANFQKFEPGENIILIPVERKKRK